MGVVDAAPMLAALLFIALAGSRLAPAPLGRTRKRPADKLLPDIFFRERSPDRVDLGRLAPAEFHNYSTGSQRKPLRAGKRILDTAAAISLIVVFAPFIVLIAIAIKIDSRGPILYRQRRIGAGGREFDMFKFRSMVTDAESNGAQWAAKNDQRVTRVGRIIRKTRFDEIPQALNILRGDMSFVGPRPERPEFVNLLEKEIPNYHLRHVVRPGLTGWAQVKYVYGASVEDARIKLQYDLHYIKHFTLWLDVVIMLMTVRVALFGVGSR